MSLPEIDEAIHIVEDELQHWEEDSEHRYSIFTQNLMLAQKVAKHEHLTSKVSLVGDDSTSFYSANSKLTTTTNTVVTVVEVPTSSQPSIEANVSESQTCQRQTEHRAHTPTGDWSWRPVIPRRISSMSTRRTKGISSGRPDPTTFHRRSCQLFSSLDSTLSAATSAVSENGRASTNTPPSLSFSTMTRTSTIADDHAFPKPRFPSFHIELDPRLSHHHETSPEDSPQYTTHRPRINPRRSSSQLAPEVVSTEQVFWTSEETRQAEYAKIDAAHTGVRGFVKRVFPRSWKAVQGARRNFCTKSSPTTDSTQSDTDSDSVRRFRISIRPETARATETREGNAEADYTTPRSTLGLEASALNSSSSLEAGCDDTKPGKLGQVQRVLAKIAPLQALSNRFGSSNKHRI